MFPLFIRFSNFYARVGREVSGFNNALPWSPPISMKL